MPEQRTDWLTGRTVIVAENRALRPNEFEADRNISRAASACPFCPGNESLTPPPEYEQFDDRGRWRVRVVPNKFPALNNPVATGGPPVAAAAEPAAATCNLAIGAHEVIIESARHIDRTSALTALELRHVLETYAERLRHWRNDGRLAYGLVFKNQGPRAGASIAHLHSQLVALPAVPSAVEAELHRAKHAFDEKHSCAYCRMLEQERTERARIVLDRDGYVAFCPFASLQPHEVWLLPANHEPSFERAASVDTLSRLADVLHDVIARLESIVPAGSFNLLLRTAPWKIDCDTWFHWRIELLPRVNSIAGLEMATGIYINPVAPERAALQLRSL
ncbi:MAG: DUF4921 family protein [Planctomycetes bacterium]|nr:DUF4921 family protein [Planctomycetota bacterium]